MAQPKDPRLHSRQLTAVDTPTSRGFRLNENGYDDDALDRLADEIAARLLVRLGHATPANGEQLVDAAEIARIYGKTRSWVYEHAGELGATRLGSGPRPRLGFSLRRVADCLENVDRPAPQPQPESPPPQRRRQRVGRTATGAPLLHVRSAQS
jgi:hypothetical protein